MAFRLDTEYRDTPSSSELTQIAFAGFDYGMRYRTNHYDEHPFGEDVSTTVERKGGKDIVEVLFPEEEKENVFDTVAQQMDADEQARLEEIYD